MDRLFIIAEYQAGKDLEEILYTIVEEILEAKTSSEKTRRMLLRALKGIIVILEAGMLSRFKSKFGEYLMGLERNRVDIRRFLVFRFIIEPLLSRITNLPRFALFLRPEYVQRAFSIAFLLFKTPISFEHLVSGSSRLEIRQQYFKVSGGSMIQYIYYLLWPTAVTGIIHGLLEWTDSLKIKEKEEMNEWLQLSSKSSPKMQAPVEQRGKCQKCSAYLQSKAYLLPNSYAYCSLDCAPLTDKYITLHL